MTRAAWRARKVLAERKRGGGRECWRRVEAARLAWGKEYQRGGQNGGGSGEGRRPCFQQREEEEDTVGGPRCKKEKASGFSVNLKFPTVLGLK